MLCTTSWSQDPPSIDSLLNQAEVLKSSDPTNLKSILATLDEASYSMSTEQWYRFLLLKGYQAALKGEVEMALSLFTEVLNNSSNIDFKYRAHYLSANNHAFLRDFESALHHLEQSLNLVDEVSDVRERNIGLGNVAIINNQLGKYDLSHQYTESVIENAQDPRRLCFAHSVNIESKLHLFGLSRFSQQIENGINACESINELVPGSLIRTYWATDLLKQGKHQAVLAVLLVNLEQVENRDYPRLSAEYYALLAQAYYALADPGRAVSFANRAISVNPEQPYALPVVKSSQLLYQNALAQGDYEAALNYFKQYAEADKAYLNEISAKYLAVQMAERDSREKTAEIELLNNVNHVLLLQKKLDNEAVQNTRLLLVLLTGLIVFIALWAYRTKLNQMRFKDMAQCDELTGAFNRRHFSELSVAHLRLAERNNGLVALVMFDLDHFKTVNDRFGHPVGDWVLQETIKVCRRDCRDYDVLGRLGGEEFAVLLPGCDLSDAKQFAEKFRRNMALIDTSISGHKFQISASFGVAEASLDGYSLKDLISTADAALYLAKSKGRNQTVESVQLYRYRNSNLTDQPA